MTEGGEEGAVEGRRESTSRKRDYAPSADRCFLPSSLPLAFRSLHLLSNLSRTKHVTYQSRQGRAKPPGRWERTSLLESCW